MSPDELVACIDFRYIDDALAADEALEILRRQSPSRGKREAEMLRDGFPAYTTSAGWMGYPDVKMVALARAAMDEGFSHLMLNVGSDPNADLLRPLARPQPNAPHAPLMLMS